MLYDITLSYGGLSVIFRNWKSAELPRSHKVFVNESSYSVGGNLIKSGVSFELPYIWTITCDLYQTDCDKLKMIWEALDYSRRNERGLTTITADATTNTLIATAHPFQNNDVVTLSTTTTLPAPLSINTDYYVVNRAANTFQVSLSLGGSAIDLTTTGTGTHQAKTQLFVRLDDESEEENEYGRTTATKTRSSVAGTTPREANGGVYYYGRFLADWVAPPEFGREYSSTKSSPNTTVRADQVLIRSVALVLQDTGVKL